MSLRACFLPIYMFMYAPLPCSASFYIHRLDLHMIWSLGLGLGASCLYHTHPLVLVRVRWNTVETEGYVDDSLQRRGT
jgi:hypothetical protein